MTELNGTLKQATQTLVQFEGVAGKANELLARAKSNGHSALASARPFTEKVQKGSETLYRARFAGLQADSAEAACKTLKRSGMSCFATRN